MADVKMAVSPEDMRSVAARSNSFAIDLYRRLMGHNGNLLFSPYSITTAMAMSYAGARGRTAEQMASTLRFRLKADRLASVMEKMNEVSMSAGVDYELAISNAMWGHAGYVFLPEFTRLVCECFGAIVEAVDFIDTEKACARINAWVAEETRGRIGTIVKPGVINRDTRLVLVNAVYFKGRWKDQFEAGRTHSHRFIVSERRVVTVDMMRGRHELDFFEDENIKVVEMPYRGDDLCMVVLLPTHVEGLPWLERTLTTEKLADWQSRLRREDVELRIPTFGMAHELDLCGPLSTMGMPDAFSPATADFSGMDGKVGLFISFVAHRAFMEVNEVGTEAAAATAVVHELCDAPTPNVFTADHPFIFVIVDNRTKAILFMGRVVNPLEGGDVK